MIRRSGLRRAFGFYDPRVQKNAAAASSVLLATGYVLSGFSGTRLLRTLRERRRGRFLAFEAGTGLVMAGLALRRKWFLVGANAAAAAGLAVAWAVTGRAVRSG